MMHSLKIIICFLAFIGVNALRAQENFVGSGGDATGSAGNSSYSVGQLLYTTNYGSGGSEAQGIQQPFEIFTSVIDISNDISLICSTYPNPATNVLTIKIKDSEKGSFLYRLYDLSGNLIDQNQIKNTETNISMSNYSPSTYFLKIIDQNREAKTFKIIKK